MNKQENQNIKTMSGQSSSPLRQRVLGLRNSWLWFVVIGALIAACGLFAAVYLLASTVIAMLLLGSLMFVGGVFQIVAAFQVTSIKPLFWSWLLSGIFFLLACFLAFAWPYETALAITLLIAVSLCASGVVRVMAGLQAKGLAGWVWFIVSGVIGILAGILIAMNLSVWALFLPGFLLACDLLFQGFSMLMFGLSLKKSIP